ncbi:hypothetical protein [Mucilaginibacter psychrotolerans]|uniref:Uncharacterized protein n=1 Tax=Mucilaginibacter psychrotolerans TaxID=1524096 RepID=A0A4Y8SKP9_9SPHI|nr:hypothetical protein [Mucilaginibacter psychrotolerans]TFF38936.1 hypothetical protein E2R66_08020 [Mucilaginibacter psychrotolerans]
MKKNLLIFCLLILPGVVMAQKPKRPLGPPTKAEDRAAILHDQCLHRNTYTAAQRRSFFPFSTAGSVKLISFEFVLYHDAEILDTAGNLINPPMPHDTQEVITPMAPNRFKLNYRKIKEIKQLSAKGLDSLTDILYNVGFTPVKNLTFEIAGHGYSCYEPRNAILFFDAAGNLTQYIELCFMCHRYYLSSRKIRYTADCEQKSDMLKGFFLAQGINYVDPRRQPEN